MPATCQRLRSMPPDHELASLLSRSYLGWSSAEYVFMRISNDGWHYKCAGKGCRKIYYTQTQTFTCQKTGGVVQVGSALVICLCSAGHTCKLHSMPVDELVMNLSPESDISRDSAMALAATSACCILASWRLPEVGFSSNKCRLPSAHAVNRRAGALHSHCISKMPASSCIWSCCSCQLHRLVPQSCAGLLVKAYRCSKPCLLCEASSSSYMPTASKCCKPSIGQNSVLSAFKLNTLS